MTNLKQLIDDRYQSEYVNQLFHFDDRIYTYDNLIKSYYVRPTEITHLEFDNMSHSIYEEVEYFGRLLQNHVIY